MNETLLPYLETLYNATFVPVHLFRNGVLSDSYPIGILPKDFLMYCKAQLDAGDGNTGSFSHIMTDTFLYLGIIRNEAAGEAVVVGPVSSLPIREEQLEKLLIQSAAPADSDAALGPLRELFLRMPTFSLYQFLNIMSLIHREINGTTVDVLTHYSGINSGVEDRIGRAHSDAMIERKENDEHNNSYYFEQTYFSLVERGDVDGLRALFRSMPKINVGVVAANSLRQVKNLFITSVALATRYAIRGGLDVETAYQLSDSYIQEVEKMTDTSAVTFLSATAIFDFAGRVADARIPAGMSQEIFRCIQYISNHVNREITVGMIASELNLDRSTLSRKFKRELGFNISSYIMRRKLEEAKSLLHFTDRTVSEISEYLCFSTQSYFQNVFKKQYGMTPKEYRKMVAADGKHTD